MRLGSEAEFSFDILNEEGNSVVSVSEIHLSEFFHSFQTIAHTSSLGFQGVLGLAEQVSSSLFLQDGTYSLWSLDTADPEQDGQLPGKNMYGVHPFVMGKAAEFAWFGVFVNLAAA